MKRDLRDNVVIVAGATGELGSRMARGLSERGAHLVLAGRDEQRLAAVAAGVPGSVQCRFDFAAADESTIVSTAIDQFGRIDGLVNAAGVVGFGPLEDTIDDSLEELVVTNLLGPLRLIRAALPHLDNGFVVNVTGVVAEHPVAGISVYSAAKAGLSAATRALARELRRRRILVIDARPGHTETGLASRPIVGVAPRMPPGLDPDLVADRMLSAIEAGEREIPSAAFTPSADPVVS
jgi:short-subunit dehydrogenase